MTIYVANLQGKQVSLHCGKDDLIDKPPVQIGPRRADGSFLVKTPVGSEYTREPAILKDDLGHALASLSPT